MNWLDYYKKENDISVLKKRLSKLLVFYKQFENKGIKQRIIIQAKVLRKIIKEKQRNVIN